ncbi:MAG: TrkH family potassium uptake protein [Lentisphaeria bacterium]|nr:TrkH family potassium uptake protein [Lentisphaeria bacterium]
MNKRAIFYLFSLLLLVMGCAMATAVPVAWLMRDSGSVILRFFFSSLVVCVCSSAVFLKVRRRKGEPEFKTGSREGFLAVFLSWMGAALIGAIPFIVIGGMRFADAFFESASGLTTTGASVIESLTVLRSGDTLVGGLESLPASLLYWRSLLNWLGGVGIVVFVLLVMPLLNPGQSGQQLYNAEVPGLKTTSDQATPRLASSIRIIFFVYLMFSMLSTFCYFVGGMTFFDAVCHAFSTVSTGGFSTKTASFGYYTSPFLQWTCIVFMILSACNFTLIVRLFVSRSFQYFKDEEFKFFLGLIIIASLIITFLLYFNCTTGINSTDGEIIPRSFGNYLRTAAFQVVSLITTTGFTTSDYCFWHVTAAVVILFLLMFPAGCGGSTAGGMKCARVFLAFKLVLSEIRHCVFPRAITDIRLNGERMTASVISKMMAFLCLYMMLFLLVGTILPFLSDMDMTTAYSASISCLSNVGPGMGYVSPNETYAWMSDSAKYLLSFTMIAGRLELYTCLVLLLPSFWRR